MMNRMDDLEASEWQIIRSNNKKMFHMVARIVIAAVGLAVAVEAWSPQSHRSHQSHHQSHLHGSLQSPCNRKGFFQKVATAALVGSASVAFVATEPAQASETASLALPKNKNQKSGQANVGGVYEPAPNSLTGKVMLITGASTGLGLESAKRLAAGGATIVLTTRTEEKGQKALEQVKSYLSEKQIQNTSVYFLTLNLDDFESVKSFPERYRQRFFGGNDKIMKIDVLMNNAGVAWIPDREITKDGFERTFQSNHLGPFMLTAGLFPYLNHNGAGARVINVSSLAHTMATLVNSGGKPGLDMGNLNGELEYEGWASYSRTKLENIMFTRELQSRADAAGLDWFTTVSLHPGLVGTDIWRYSYMGTKTVKTNEKKSDSRSLQAMASNLFYSSALPTDVGANTQVWLAATGEDENTLVKGQYFDEHQQRQELANYYAQDKDKAVKLWEMSEQFSGVTFKLELSVVCF
jgi:NAD(P)-dependent dehydrogenase (short-subunit alcohol dehydrogenase family)